MTTSLFESLAGTMAAAGAGFAIAPAVVTNNIDSFTEGRVQVRIPTRPGIEPWARLLAVGGGPERGFYWVPQIDDEVLVAFHDGDVTDAFVLGGLWNAKDDPPVGAPTDALNKRVIKTGIAGGLGHEVEFDDLGQSIKVESSTGQKVTIDPQKIELENTAGTLKITMDNLSQTITLEAALSINIKSMGQVSIEGTNVSIKGTALTSISGGLVKIN